jgi:Rrf2 family transcriptional regulator, iron-sulfur cluster assembly transcription factor
LLQFKHPLQFSNMFLNQTSHYALRAMTGLVISGSNEPVRSKELAEQTGVPSHYLSKIMRKMVEAGYILSRKGHGGGFIMKIAPSELRIIDVLTAAGFNIDEQPCVFGYNECSDHKPCPLHPVWKRLKNCFTDWACNTTFEDIRQESRIIDGLDKW